MHAKSGRDSGPLTIVVAGGTGDLARRKLFPALFACYARGHLPPDVRFVGLARTPMEEGAFRARLEEGLHCEELEAGACSLQAGEFLRRCHYCRCDYEDAAGYAAADRQLLQWENGVRARRLIYLAVPPFVFGGAVRAMAQSGFLPRTTQPWTRLVVEKPFGRDRASYDTLAATLAEFCAADQLFQIDHYLGKEVVQNLLVLRFANSLFEPLWTHQQISHVHIAWSEAQGVAGRAGYFDQYGIVRDVMQNHLMQILSLVAMEPPATLAADAIRDAKVAVLRAIPPLEAADLILGQYQASPGSAARGYLQEEGVPAASRTPTYAAAVVRLDTPRWQGVPFLLTAGKGLRAACTEVRIHFRERLHLFEQAKAALPCAAAANELLIRVQPDEKLALRIVSKLPGVGMQLGATELDLRFREKYPRRRIADAYENLLLDVVRGDHSLFIRSDELAAAWDIFTPVLHQWEAQGAPPEPYALGGDGPAALHALARSFGIYDAVALDGEIS
jgi:glucose-6-phosphate 1-dehydrogenase